jgi:hypothetical protein
MAIKPRDVPTILVQRIEAAHPAPALFGADETQDWPSEVLPALLTQGVLVEADRAKSISCPGCEWQCNKRVVVRKAGDTSRAFITCDEEPDQGRVQVLMASLARVAVTLPALSQIVASALDIGPPKASRSLNAYSLGTVNGRNGARPVAIAIENGGAVLDIGDQRVPIAQALTFSPAGLAIDTRLVRRLADRKMANMTQRRQYARDRSQQTARKAATRKRDLAIFHEATKRLAEGRGKVSNVAKIIAKTKLADGLSAERVRRIITEQGEIERKNSRPKPKMRK